VVGYPLGEIVAINNTVKFFAACFYLEARRFFYTAKISHYSLYKHQGSNSCHTETKPDYYLKRIKKIAGRGCREANQPAVKK
jgi:hypothetical protein